MNLERSLEHLNCINVIRFAEPMSGHTSFRAGGIADAFAEPGNREELAEIIAAAEALGVPYFIMGNGTNVLVRDEGYRGIIIKLGDGFRACEVNGLTVKAGAGASLSAMAKRAAEESVSGFEELSGIPGTVGGAVRMNAGAYGVSISDVIKEIYYLEDGECKVMDASDDCFSYRYSVFCDKPGAVILGALFEGKDIKSKDLIVSSMNGYTQKRKASQPLEFPSAGSTFKRPKEGYASRLIDECGLKGLGVGGAKVSEKHAGFIINCGGATAGDILALMKKVRDIVYAEKGVELEPEIVIL